MMKHFLIALTVIVFASTAQAADVGVSVSVGQPGFYSRIGIADSPHPRTVYPKPIVIMPPPGRMVAEPIYLYVPAGQSRNWSRHCHEYGACGKAVHFVQDRWYDDVYATGHYEGGIRHGRGHGHGRY